MKPALWILFALAAAVWTGFALLAAAGVEWSAEAIASGRAADLAGAAAAWPVPGWLAAWIDVEVVQAMQRTLLGTIDLVRTALPSIGSAVAWLEPLVWVLWAGGIVAMLAAAAAVHLLLGRLPGRLRAA